MALIASRIRAIRWHLPVLALILSLACGAVQADPACAARDYLHGLLTRAQALADAPGARHPQAALRAVFDTRQAAHALETLEPLMPPGDVRRLRGFLRDARSLAQADAGQLSVALGDRATRAARRMGRAAAMNRLLALHCGQGTASGGIAPPATQNPYPGQGDTLAQRLAAPFIAFARRAAALIPATPPMRFVSLALLSGSLAFVLIRLHARHQRRHERFSCALPCTVAVGATTIQAQIADISEQGCKVTAPIEPPRGGIVHLSFGPHHIDARVAWSTISSFGVQFAHCLTAEDVARLTACSATPRRASSPAARPLKSGG